MPPRRAQVTEQISLLPAERPRAIANMDVPVAEIERVRHVIAPADLQESVRNYGVLQPVILIDRVAWSDDGVGYDLAGGRRRVDAARRVGLTEVPAIIFPAGTPREVAAAMSATENIVRSPNPMTDLEAIETLLATGATEQQVALDLHLPLATVRARLQLRTLIRELRRETASGNLPSHLATRVARLDQARQEQLLRIMRQRRRDDGQATLTRDDVIAVIGVTQPDTEQVPLPITIQVTEGDEITPRAIEFVEDVRMLRLRLPAYEALEYVVPQNAADMVRSIVRGAQLAIGGHQVILQEMSLLRTELRMAREQHRQAILNEERTRQNQSMGAQERAELRERQLRQEFDALRADYQEVSRRLDEAVQRAMNPPVTITTTGATPQPEPVIVRVVQSGEDGEGWAVATALLERARNAIPAVADDEADAWYAQISDMIARAEAIAGMMDQPEPTPVQQFVVADESSEDMTEVNTRGRRVRQRSRRAATPAPPVVQSPVRVERMSPEQRRARALQRTNETRAGVDTRTARAQEVPRARAGQGAPIVQPPNVPHFEIPATSGRVVQETDAMRRELLNAQGEVVRRARGR